MTTTVRTVRLLVRGRVQGVGFRAFVADAARRRGLEGFVRNRRDGAVEAVIAGPADVVEDMIDACRRGPPSSVVAGVDVQDEPGRADAAGRGGFAVLPTI